MNATVMTEQKCEWCGEQFSKEEIESTREKGMCDECFHEHREFTCCRCDEYEEKKHQHRFLVVFEPTDSWGGTNIQPGIYEIIEYPYHGGPMIGRGYLFGRSLRNLNKTVDWESNGYPCGHLCLWCQRGLHLRQSKKGKALHAKDTND